MNKSLWRFLLMPCFLLVSCGGGTNKTPSTPNEPATEEDDGDNSAQVVILLGQSNMEGNAYNMYLKKTIPQKADMYAQGFSDVKIAYHNSGGYTSNGEFVDVNLGQGYTENRFGPEVGIAEAMHNANKKNVFLIKYAIGATSLSGHWIPPSCRAGGGPLYKEAVKFVLDCINKLEDMGYYPEIKAICWMQGEDDSNGNQYNSYYTYTKHFVEDLREAWKLYMDLDGIGFIDAAILASDIWKEHEIINNAKKKAAEEDELSEFIDTNAAGLHTNYEPVGAVDPYHYDSDSMITLGQLFGNVLLNRFID